MNHSSDRRPKIIELSASQDVSMADDWFNFAVEDHFWMQWRFNTLMRFAGERLQTGGLGLDIGSGNGVVAAQIEAKTSATIDCCELNETALRNHAPIRGKLYRYDIRDQHPEVTGRYKHVFLLDVIEHVKDDVAFLSAAASHLGPDGVLYANVPALPILFSQYDTAQGHFRRYTQRTIRKLLDDSGLQLIRIRPWALTMIPVLLLRKAVLAATPSGDVVSTGFEPSSRLIDLTLRGMAAFEQAYLKSPPFGTSLMVSACRAKSQSLK